MFLRGRLKPEGSLFFTYLGLYSGWRIAIGFMREGTDFLFGLHQAQIIGILVLLIIIPVMIAKTRWGKPEVDLPEEPTNKDIPSSPDTQGLSGNDSGEETETGENEVKNG
jgi:prolipoprotein diacylglyceryltransferase